MDGISTFHGNFFVCVRSTPRLFTDSYPIDWGLSNSNLHINHPGNLLMCQFCVPGLRYGLRFYISNKHTCDAFAAYTEAALWVAKVYSRIVQHCAACSDGVLWGLPTYKLAEDAY